MPRTRAKAGTAKPAETIKPVEPEEQVDLDEPEEMMEEEVEYEEIEEEVEEDEEEEVIEEEVEEEDIEAATADGADPNATANGDGGMKIDETKDGESEKHDELLALPPHGSEVYIGGIPHDASEDDLKSACESVGEVTEVRVMKAKDSSENKGYAFVTFRTKELAEAAVEDLNNSEFKGRKIKCSRSQAKNRLFIGNIPRNWVEDDLKETVFKVGPGVSKVDLVKDSQNSSRNKGFAFIEYYNYACAEYSRKKMSNSKFKLDTNTPTVSWADSKNGDSSTSQVRAVYVKNLPNNVTQDQLKKLYEHHGEITRVVLPPAKPGQERRYGFVHFAEPLVAMKAINSMEKYELDGQVLECSLAKPHVDKKVDTMPNSRKGALIPNHPPRAGYGVMSGAYGSTPGLGQPMIYGRGNTPAGMTMVPLVLPDGRLAYVLQQPPVPVLTPQRVGGRGGSSSGGRRGNDNSRGRKYQPY